MVVLKPDEELRELGSLSLTIKSMFCKREKVPVSNVNQQNDKSTEEYQRTIWIRSHSTVAPMGKLWEKNIVKASNYNNHRIFTLRCIGLNLIPLASD